MRPGYTPKGHQIACQIPIDVYAQLRTYATVRGLSLHEGMRVLITEGLENQGEDVGARGQRSRGGTQGSTAEPPPSNS